MDGQSEFKEAVGRSIDLLMSLPKWAARLDDAKAAFSELRAEHPDIDMELLAHVDRQEESVDFDVLLEHPGRGVVALNFTPDDGIPWNVLHADQLPSNLIVTVNEEQVTVQDALLMLTSGDSDRTPMDALIEAALIHGALTDEPLPISMDELQQASDAFRRANGLTTAAATHAWMQRRGLTRDSFDALVRKAVLTQKLKDKVTTAGVEAHFTEHRTQYATARIARASTRALAPAEQMAARAVAGVVDLASTAREMAPEHDDLRIFVGLCRRDELDPELAEPIFQAAANEVIGPILTRRTYDVVQVLEHRPARLDPATRRAIRDHLFRQWLLQKRAAANIIWHWAVER